MAFSHPPLSLTEPASQPQSIYLTFLFSLWLTVGTTPSSQFDQTTCLWVTSQVPLGDQSGALPSSPCAAVIQVSKAIKDPQDPGGGGGTCVISPRSGLGLFYTQVTSKALAPSFPITTDRFLSDLHVLPMKLNKRKTSRLHVLEPGSPPPTVCCLSGLLQQNATKQVDYRQKLTSPISGTFSITLLVDTVC